MFFILNLLNIPSFSKMLLGTLQKILLIANKFCFSCEGSLLASGSADCSVKLWDVTASTKLLKTEEK